MVKCQQFTALFLRISLAQSLLLLLLLSPPSTLSWVTGHIVAISSRPQGAIKHINQHKHISDKGFGGPLSKFDPSVRVRIVFKTMVILLVTFET